MVPALVVPALVVLALVIAEGRVPLRACLKALLLCGRRIAQLTFHRCRSGPVRLRRCQRALGWMSSHGRQRLWADPQAGTPAAQGFSGGAGLV